MVHQFTLKEYNEVNYKYVPSAHDNAERDFNAWCKLSGRAPKITVNHITRVKVTNAELGQPEEFLTWGETRTGYDHVGNEKTFTEDRMGSYIFPIFNKTWATQTNTIVATAITKKETRYDTPFTPEKMAELYSMADKVNCRFYVKSGSNRFTIRYYEDFLRGRYEDLVELGQSKFSTLQELLNARQTMIPVSTVDKLVETKEREKARGRKED